MNGGRFFTPLMREKVGKAIKVAIAYGECGKTTKKKWGANKVHNKTGNTWKRSRKSQEKIEDGCGGMVEEITTTPPWKIKPFATFENFHSFYPGFTSLKSSFPPGDGHYGTGNDPEGLSFLKPHLRRGKLLWRSDRDRKKKMFPLDKRKESEYSTRADNHDSTVVLGGGRRHWLPKVAKDPETINSEGRRLDGRNLIDDWVRDKKRRGLKCEYVWNKSQLEKVNPKEVDHLLGAREHPKGLGLMQNSCLQTSFLFPTQNKKPSTRWQSQLTHNCETNVESSRPEESENRKWGKAPDPSEPEINVYHRVTGRLPLLQ
ncbi:hypothetical protein RUM43_009265 [Polyplax serrata]|uniref:alkaline phosphatase n=1 Tax=Polyplax serrata TaxID=468196 RepID=A0AAN8PAJ4_POLSC